MFQYLNILFCFANSGLNYCIVKFRGLISMGRKNDYIIG